MQGTAVGNERFELGRANADRGDNDVVTAAPPGICEEQPEGSGCRACPWTLTKRGPAGVEPHGVSVGAIEEHEQREVVGTVTHDDVAHGL